jgi:glycerophosphoryl diester phosphodiesterase
MTGSVRWPLARVLAHRCGGALAPENTLAGLRAALAAGCGGVEFDVMLGGSGSAVLIHDETLERTTDGRGAVADATDDYLSGLDAGSWFDPRFADERVPTFVDAARQCIALGLGANVEIKPSAGTERDTGRIVARAAGELWADAPDAPLLSSFSEAALEVAAEIAPQLPRGLLVGAVPADWLQRCRRLGVRALHVDARCLDQSTVLAACAEGLWVATYTVNDPSVARRLFDWGVDCVITDRPDLVRYATDEPADAVRHPSPPPGRSS